MSEIKKRDYKIENERQQKIYKQYHVKIPKYKAEILDNKLKEKSKTFKSLVDEAIENFLKKS